MAQTIGVVQESCSSFHSHLIYWHPWKQGVKVKDWGLRTVICLFIRGVEADVPRFKARNGARWFRDNFQSCRLIGCLEDDF